MERREKDIKSTFDKCLSRCKEKIYSYCGKKCGLKKDSDMEKLKSDRKKLFHYKECELDPNEPSHSLYIEMLVAIKELNSCLLLSRGKAGQEHCKAIFLSSKDVILQKHNAII
jgi:hypothetical protein